MQVTIGWGLSPREVTVPDGATVFAPPPPPPPVDWAPAVAGALARPVGSAPIADRLRAARQVVVVVPDDTRKAVAGPVLAALIPLLERAGVRWQIAVATGKHPPRPQGPAGAWVHDAQAPDLVAVGRTAHGTDVRFPPAVLAADLRILVGEVRPHYFTGWAGGAKTLFPGVAGAEGIWHNHTLKAAPGARLGQIEGNPCRADLEAAAALAGPSVIINAVRSAAGLAGVVAGDPILAHRAAVALARPVFEIHPDRRFDAVLVSDGHPVTASLYQACKLLPPAGALLAPGGRVVIAAALHAGVGPVSIINDQIYRLGVVHALPADHQVRLVSGRSAAEVQPTFCTPAPDVATALAGVPGERVAVLPWAGDLAPRPAPWA